MGLSQSLYTGWSGLASHQKSMDNIGNNLANVNTVGYKKSDYLFSSIFKQAISGSNPADGDRGATNPKNLGMGVTTGAISGNFTTGPIENTGRTFDCAINGNGFFLVKTGAGTALTRNGSFYLDSENSNGERMLCAGDGLPVQGWMAQNGVVTPSTSVDNIYLPAIGDLMPGRTTGEVDLKGILPTNTSTSDFNGRQTTNLELMGNLPGSGSITTHIFASVSQTDGVSSLVKDEVQEVKVQINFIGPTESADGTVNNWTWTMTTVDWPNPGDPGVQIYPTEDDPGFSQGAMGFHNQGSTTDKYGAGQPVSDSVAPGSTRVSASIPDEEGNTITTFFNMPSDFTVDISHMTNMANPPVDNGLGTWYVDGNPTGTMARTITVFDEYTEFEEQGGVMTAVRRVEARQNTIYFERTERTDESATWSWRSSLGDATGALEFNTSGELVSSSQSGGGGITYNFADVQNINHEGAMQATGQDGYRDGVLLDFSIDGNGKIWGRYSNQMNEQLAQLALGTVANPQGLSNLSGTLFYVNPSVSGELLIGVAGDGSGSSGLPSIGAGAIASNSLEGSNVELAKEFTSMISTERGYQFSSRIVSTANEMLQTALQLKQ